MIKRLAVYVEAFTDKDVARISQLTFFNDEEKAKDYFSKALDNAPWNHSLALFFLNLETGVLESLAQYRYNVYDHLSLELVVSGEIN